MKLLQNKLALVLIVIAVVVVATVGADQFLALAKAHSTFENYSALRGCVDLVKKTDDYGICKTNSGQTIKIVKSHGKWYLDGDVPICVGDICW